MLVAAVAVTFLSAVVPQREVRIPDKGKLVLPPTQKTQEPKAQKPADAAMPQTRDGLQRRFHERVLELRRSRHLSSTTEEDLLLRLGSDFGDAADRAIELARIADADLLHGVLRVLGTYGGPAHASELRFLLQTRPLGKSTRQAVETVAAIGRDKSKELLFDLFTARREAVRRYAANALEPKISDADAQRLLTFAGQGRSDVRLRAARLLGHIRTDQVTKTLIDMLRERSAIAEAACRGLIRQGVDAAPALQEVLSHPAKGRGFGFAAYALAAIEATARKTDDSLELFTEPTLPHLVAELDMPDPFMQSACSIALAGVAWRSDDTSGDKFGDALVVDKLVKVVAPVEFVPQLALIQDLARQRLVRFTGRDFRMDTGRWRDWWQSVDAGTGYVAARRSLAIDAKGANLAALTWRYSPEAAEERGVSTMRIRGVDAVSLSPSTDLELDIVVTPEAMMAALEELKAAGFMTGEHLTALEGSDAPMGSLRLNVGAARCQTPPDIDDLELKPLEAIVQRVVRKNAWQLYRDPTAEPDAEAFWRAERRWIDAHQGDDAALRGRFVDRVTSRIAALSGRHLDLALDHLSSVDELRTVFTEQHAKAVLDALVERGHWDERSARMADMVLAAGDAAPWRGLLTAAQSLSDGEAGSVLPRMFSLLGVDRVLEALDDENEVVQIAAVDEVVSMREQRAVPRLVEMLRSDSLRLQSSAAYALGQLRASDARAALVDLLARGVRQDGGISPHLRRIVWVALARVGGDDVFSILSAAFYSPEPEDRAAVLRAYAELRRPEAAREIAGVFALRGPDDDLGLLSLQLLRGMGDTLASPALRPHLESTNASVRVEAALVMARFGDPAVSVVLPELLERSEEPFRTLAGVAAVTGLDLGPINDRQPYLREWLARNGKRTQGQWLVDALARFKVEHSLDTVRLVAGVGASQVPELSRLLTEVEPALLRPLVARLLRVTTGEDYGVVDSATTDAELKSLAERYRFFADAGKAASGR